MSMVCKPGVYSWFLLLRVAGFSEYASTDYHDTREKEKMVPALYTPRSPKRTAPGTGDKRHNVATLHIGS